MSLPLPKVDPQAVMGRLNDDDANGAYAEALRAMVDELRAGGTPAPRVLVLLDRAAVLTTRLLRLGCRVTHVEHDPGAQRLAQTAAGELAGHPALTWLLKHPTQLPANAGYDALAIDVAGPQRGAAVLARDLWRRKVVAPRHGKQFAVPVSAAMTARLYRCDELGADAYVPGGLFGDTTLFPLPAKPKIAGTQWPTEQQLGVALRPGAQVSDRVEVCSEIYWDEDDAACVEWPSHIRLVPHRSGTPPALCVVALEWVVQFDHGRAVGTVLGHQLSARAARARAAAWPRPCAEVRFLQRDSPAEVRPLLLRCDCRPAGGVTLEAVDAVPAAAGTKRFDAAKAAAIAAATYNKT